jgi:hypothetical protein
LVSSGTDGPEIGKSGNLGDLSTRKNALEKLPSLQKKKENAFLGNATNGLKLGGEDILDNIIVKLDCSLVIKA